VLGPYASEKQLDRAAELNPNLPLIYDQYGWTFSEMGRFDDAIAAEKKALELDPLNTFLNTDLAFFLYWARRYEEAITQIRKTLELDPNNAFAHSILGWCLIWKVARLKQGRSSKELRRWMTCHGMSALSATPVLSRVIVRKPSRSCASWKIWRSSDMSHPRTGRQFI